MLKLKLAPCDLAKRLRLVRCRVATKKGAFINIVCARQ